LLFENLIWSSGGMADALDSIGSPLGKLRGNKGFKFGEG